MRAAGIAELLLKEIAHRPLKIIAAVWLSPICKKIETLFPPYRRRIARSARELASDWPGRSGLRLLDLTGGLACRDASGHTPSTMAAKDPPPAKR